MCSKCYAYLCTVTSNQEAMNKKEKALLGAFGDKYITIENNGGYCLYDKEHKSRRSNYTYLGKFYISTDKEKYVFNDAQYATPETLIKAMGEYNETLPFSAGNYDPTYRRHIMVEYCIDDYLRELGFEYSWDRIEPIYSLKDSYGQEICTITVEMTEDTTEGKVLRFIKGRDKYTSSWVEIPFHDLDSAIGAVNTMISAYCAFIGSKVTGILSNLTNARCSQMYQKTFDVRSLTLYTEDAKAKMIETLEKELKLLKGE